MSALRQASQSPTHGGQHLAASRALSLYSPTAARFGSQSSLFSLGDTSGPAPMIPTPALLLVPSQVPRARSDTLDLFLSSFLCSFSISAGMRNLAWLALLFSAISTVIEAGTGQGLSRLYSHFLPWLLSTLLCAEAARDLTVCAVLLIVCLCLSVLSFFSMAAYASAWRAAPPGSPPPTRGLLLRHCTVLAVYTAWMITFMGTATISPLWACFGMILAISVMLKIHSFFMTNLAMALEKDSATGSAGWPGNVQLLNFAQFLVFPTLTYEASFPRSPSIRPSYLLWKAAQGGIAIVVGFSVLFFSVIPILAHPTPPASLSALPSRLQAPIAFLLDLTRLALPSICCWCAVFVGFFSCCLGILAELTRFADREFFGPWWEAQSIGAFWSSWNAPVHKWAKRHLLLELQIYLHLKRRGAVLATFLLSALLHEVIISTAFKTIRPYFFFAMLFQLPLISLSRVLQGEGRHAAGGLGNSLVWLSLFLGQPVLELLYAREFLLQNGHRTGRDLLCLSQ